MLRWRAPLGAKTADARFKARMIAPQFVKPYVKSNENDANDAEAICEAISRSYTRFAAEKIVKQRTAKSNQIRNWIVSTSMSINDC